MNTDTITKQLTASAGRTRRQVLKSLGAGAAGLAGLRVLGGTAWAAGSGFDDFDVLQYALNLEYLEAEYYLYATTGQGLPPEDITGKDTLGMTTIKANPQVPFSTPLIEQYAKEIASDEKHHVEYLRASLSALGDTPVARPPLDLLESFNTAAQAAGIGDSFDPFENEVNFLLGAFIFEDVGVTAYRGGAKLLKDKGLIFAAAGVLGTEAYHAANIRTALLALNNPDVIEIAQKISDLRDTLDGSGDKDQGLTDSNGDANVVPTDPDGLVFGRRPREVLNIVYGARGVSSGLFFPNGLNGKVS